MEEPKDREISAHQKTPISSYGALSRRPNSFIQAYSLITTLMRIARRLLSASASSILLSEESSQRLIFAFADGSSGEQIRQLKISKNSGIAGWVVTNGEPLIVNDVYQDKHFNNFVDSVTGHTTKSIICVPLVLQDKIIGVVEIVNTLDGNDFSERDLNTLKIIAAPVAQVIDSIRRSKRNFITHNNAISMLLSAIEARKSSMNGHAKRVSQYALTGATALSLSKEEKQVIEYAAALHDIGKLSISERILDNSANLANEERVVLHKHPIIGFNMLKGIAFLQGARELILYHHERYDGNGYPKGLKGDAIPIGARLIAVADAFDNMTTEHFHHTGLSKKEALMELNRDSGSKFDPAAVKAFRFGFIKSLRPNTN